MKSFNRADNASRKRQDADYKRRRWLEDQRRRRKRQEDEKRRIWAWVLLLVLLDNLDKQVKTLVASFVARPAPPPTSQQARPRPGTSETQPFDINAHIRRDYACRPGEGDREVMDGMTAADIHQVRDSHRPRHQISGLPDRYCYEWPHVNTLLDHLPHDFLRKDAIKALIRITPRNLHAWIVGCAASETGWKDIRRCRSATGDATIAAMVRAAWQAQEDRRLEVEELKKSLQNRNQVMANEDLNESSPIVSEFLKEI